MNIFFHCFGRGYGETVDIYYYYYFFIFFFGGGGVGIAKLDYFMESFLNILVGMPDTSDIPGGRQ